MTLDELREWVTLVVAIATCVVAWLGFKLAKQADHDAKRSLALALFSKRYDFYIDVMSAVDLAGQPDDDGLQMIERAVGLSPCLFGEDVSGTVKTIRTIMRQLRGCSSRMREEGGAAPRIELAEQRHSLFTDLDNAVGRFRNACATYLDASDIRLKL